MQTMFPPGGGNVSVLLFVEIFLFFFSSLPFCSVICSVSFFFHSIIRRVLSLNYFFSAVVLVCVFCFFISNSFVVIFLSFHLFSFFLAKIWNQTDFKKKILY